MKNKTMYDYLALQPVVLNQMLKQRSSLTEEFAALYREIMPTHLYLIGSGTSLNAQQIAMPFIEQLLDVEVKTMPSSRITEIRGARPMIVFLSQGGSSTNTLDAMERLKDYPYITITGEKECEIGRRSRRLMLIGCPQELVGPKTVGYTASVMILYLAALETSYAVGRLTAARYQEYIRVLTEAVTAMTVNIERAVRWLETNQEDLIKIKNYVFVGQGITALALVEGCLKVLETIKVPAMSFEFEEYLHGPILFTEKHLGGFFFISEETDSKERMLQLALTHREYSHHGYIITSDKEITGAQVLHIEITGQPYTEVFESVIVPQLLSARLPEIMGIPEGADIYDTYTSKCPTKYKNGR